MLRRRLAATSVAAAAMAVAGLAGPGSADTSPITLNVAGGALSIDAPASISGSGGIGGNTTLTVTGIAINDTRGTGAAWSATATSTNLTTGTGVLAAERIANSLMTWTTTAITPTQGQAQPSIPSSGTLESSVVIANAAAGDAAGAFTVDGTITFLIPVNNVTGSYTGTLTTTIS